MRHFHQRAVALLTLLERLLCALARCNILAQLFAECGQALVHPTQVPDPKIGQQQQEEEACADPEEEDAVNPGCNIDRDVPVDDLVDLLWRQGCDCGVERGKQLRALADDADAHAVAVRGYLAGDPEVEPTFGLDRVCDDGEGTQGEFSFALLDHAEGFRLRARRPAGYATRGSHVRPAR